MVLDRVTALAQADRAMRLAHNNIRVRARHGQPVRWVGPVRSKAADLMQGVGRTADPVRRPVDPAREMDQAAGQAHNRRVARRGHADRVADQARSNRADREQDTDRAVGRAHHRLVAHKRYADRVRSNPTDRKQDADRTAGQAHNKPAVSKQDTEHVAGRVRSKAARTPRDMGRVVARARSRRAAPQPGVAMPVRPVLGSLAMRVMDHGPLDRVALRE
ncbi:hypothetical protein [Nocardia sp. NPDC058633]|uniref:hypothetical protein n=1 Tax=Nocardia sp. NPDC058633 TaxID=3346568 RepID=UPI0036487EF6